MKVSVSGTLYITVENIKAKPIPLVSLKEGGEDKREQGELAGVRLKARHSDLGSLAVQS